MEPRSILKKGAPTKKALKVRHSLTKTITPVLRRNEKTGTMIDPDLLNIDDLFDPTVNVEEQISPLSSPGSPVDIETPIVPNLQMIKAKYKPIIVVIMVKPDEEPQIINDVLNGYLKQDVNNIFIYNLKKNGIKINKNTQIDYLESLIQTMFEKMTNNDFIGCEFYRIDDKGNKIVFDRNNENTLETYSELIESPSTNDPRKFNYFYINVYLKYVAPAPKGGSRKNKTNRKRKTNRKKKTNRR